MRWHPFAEKFPLLQGEEREALKASIRQTNGVEEQPILYRVVNGEQEGLDGRNRYVLCGELGIEPHMRQVGVADGDVKDFVLRRNVHRRHMDKELRQKIVAELRGDGESTRRIAATLGVSVGTVHSDIQAAGAAGQVFNSEHLQTVTGRDGKTYPAQQARAHGAGEGDVELDQEPPAGGAPACPYCHTAHRPDEGCTFAERQPGDDTEQIEAEEAEEKARPRNGTPLFDWKRFEERLGYVVRAPDELASAYPGEQRCAERARCEEAMHEYCEAVNSWKRRLTNSTL